MGIKIQVTSGDDPGCEAVIDGQRVPFRIWEWSKRSEHVLSKAELKEREQRPNSWYERWDYHPSGRLVLEIGGWHEGISTKFVDRKRRRLEEKLGSFIESLHLIAQQEKEREQQRIRRYRQELEEEAKRCKEQRRREEEQKRVQELLNQVANWHRSTQVREFISAAETKRIETSGAIAPGTPFVELGTMGHGVCGSN